MLDSCWGRVPTSASYPIHGFLTMAAASFRPTDLLAALPKYGQVKPALLREASFQPRASPNWTQPALGQLRSCGRTDLMEIQDRDRILSWPEANLASEFDDRSILSDWPSWRRWSSSTYKEGE